MLSKEMLEMHASVETGVSRLSNILGARCSFETFQVVHVCVFGPVDGCQASDLFLRGFGPHVISAPANRA